MSYGYTYRNCTLITGTTDGALRTVSKSGQWNLISAIKAARTTHRMEGELTVSHYTVRYAGGCDQGPRWQVNKHDAATRVNQYGEPLTGGDQ